MEHDSTLLWSVLMLPNYKCLGWFELPCEDSTASRHFTYTATEIN